MLPDKICHDSPSAYCPLLLFPMMFERPLEGSGPSGTKNGCEVLDRASCLRGEHAGDVESVQSFDDVDLDYVSCSPFGVPVARLEAKGGSAPVSWLDR